MLRSIRARLAYDLTKWVLGIIALLALTSIFVAARVGDKELLEMMKLLLTALLPVFGSWVGTVLAYYYSKDAFETATRLSRPPVVPEIAPVGSAMLSMQVAKHLRLGPDETLDGVTIARIDREFGQTVNGRPIGRLPVLSAAGSALAILHRPTWDRVKAASDRVTGGNTDTALSIGQLGNHLAMDAAGLGDLGKFRSTMAFVALVATLADARAAMERIGECEDVFITAGGRPDEPVVGWITDTDLLKALDIR